MGVKNREQSMLLANFVRQLKKIWFSAVVAILFCGLGGAFYGYYFVAPYQTSVSLDIARLGTQAAADYKYDGYYAIMAADEFSKNIQFWFKSPGLVTEIFNQAGLPAPGDINDLAGVFKAKKLSPQYLEVTYGTATDQDAKKLAQGLKKTLAEKSEGLGKLSQGSAVFSVQVNEPIIFYAQKSNVETGLAIGFMLGLILSLAFGFVTTKQD